MTTETSTPTGIRGWLPTSRTQLVARGLLVVAIVGFVVWGLSTDGYFTVANLKAILISMAVVGIVGVGMTTIMVSGSLVSLSLGTSAAVGAMVFVYTLQNGLAVAVLLTLAFGVVVVGVQGLVIGAWAANPIVLTIAAGSLQIGIGTAITNGATVTTRNTSYAVLNHAVAGIPVSIIVAVVFALLAELLLRRTALGQQARLAGTSRAAARAAGLSLGRIGAGMFAIAGASAAIAGMLLAASNQQGSFLLEGTLTFDAIAATLVGGASIAGGHGSPIRTMIGAFAIAAASDLLLLNSFSTSAQVLMKGVLVLVVVVAVHLRARKAG